MNSNKARVMTFITSCLIAFVFTCLASVNVMAQATTGTLRGSVTDTTGAVIPSATVTVKSEATGAVSTLTTGGEGTFDAPALTPGTYTVTVEATGFKKSVTTGVPVKIGIVNPFTTQLEAGNVAETVTVTGGGSEELVVQRDEAQISTTVNTKQVENLPSNGAAGGLDTLALLAPGVVGQRSTGANTNGSGLSVNGNRGRSNNFQIDGADNNDLSVTGPALFVDFEDQVQEYQVITNNFSAQYGRNQGAVINIVTKSGTNTYHGTLFDFHQDAFHLNSLNNIERASGQTRPNRNLLNVFGGTAGGPVYIPRFGEGGKGWLDGHNRLFFFFGYQGVRNPSLSTGSTTSLGVAPSEFSRLLAQFPTSNVIRNIVTNGPTAVTLRGPAVPNSFVAGTPVQALISTNLAGSCAKAIGITDTPAAGCTYANLGNFLIRGPYDVLNFGTPQNPFLVQGFQYQRSVATPYVENYWNLQFDGKINNNNSVTFRILHQVQDSINQLSCCSSGWNGDVPATSKHIGGDWAWTASSKIVNQVRANYQIISVDFGGGCAGGTPGCIEGSAQIATQLANFAFSGALGLTKSNALGGFGPATNLPQGRTGKVYQIAEKAQAMARAEWAVTGPVFLKFPGMKPYPISKAIRPVKQY